MLLCEVTINAVLNRVSNEYIGSLTHPWHRRILQFGPITYGIYRSYGGFMKFDTGSISFTPELFENDWPPPLSCPLTVKYTSTTEEAAETILTANLHIEEITREQVVYGLYRTAYADVLPDATAFTAASQIDTLALVFGACCTILGIDLDITLARNPSPAVEYTTSGEQLIVDFLDGIAAGYTHMAYIDIAGTTLYLIDMLDKDNGSRTLTEYEYLGVENVSNPVRYYWDPPIGIAKAGDFSAVSSYTYGTEESVTAYHDTQANIETALADIITVANRARTELPIPFAGDVPDPAEKITFPDTSNVADLSTYIRTRTLTYDFDNEEVIIDGDGVISK